MGTSGSIVCSKWWRSSHNSAVAGSLTRYVRFRRKLFGGVRQQSTVALHNRASNGLENVQNKNFNTFQTVFGKKSKVSRSRHFLKFFKRVKIEVGLWRLYPVRIGKLNYMMVIGLSLSWVPTKCTVPSAENDWPVLRMRLRLVILGL